MKKIIVAIILVTLLPCLALASDRVVHISSGEWAPMTGKDLAHGGFINHVIREAFSRMGHEVQIDFFPWARSYALMLYGEVDASSYWFTSKKRDSECLYSDPINTEEVVFFHLKGKPIPSWKTLEDLGGMNIAVTTGVTYTDEFLKLGREGAYTLFPSTKQIDNFTKLIRGRVDAFPTSKRAGLNILRKSFSPAEQNAITYDEKPLTITPGHLAFTLKRKDSRKLLQTFNEGLKAIRKDGTYDRLKQDLMNGVYNARH